MTGLAAPAHWIGLVYEEQGRVVGLGGLYEGQDGRWWASVQARARRPVALARAAREVLATARAVGVPVFAIADVRIAGAEAFLSRLGFHETDEAIEGHKVLKWTP
jgi:hypothetical protein